jgi:hypothetical protein
LLFINSSANEGEYRNLARAIAGEDVALISGNAVFRTFAGITRLQLQQVGLSEQLGRSVRYTGHMGSDVESGVSDVQRRTARKSVLSGVGFAGGEKIAVGASRKGRIWSHRRGHIVELVTWCAGVGKKLVDETIDPEAVLRGTLVGKRVSVRPEKVPFAVDWPEEMYAIPEGRWLLELGGKWLRIDEVDLRVAAHRADGPLRIEIDGDQAHASFTLELFEKDGQQDFRFVTTDQVRIRKGDSGRDRLVAEFLSENPPKIWFVDGSSLEGNEYVELKGDRPPYDAAKIMVWDWSGVDIRKESQGSARAADSVQGRVIRELKGAPYDVIVDDDRRGEAADVVAIRVVKKDARDAIDVEFYHCKFSGADAPGARVDDLYEVCGQAQKSICWMLSSAKRMDLFTHLLRRTAEGAKQRDRFEGGDRHRLQQIREMSHSCEVRLSVFIVQPGLSKGRVSSSQLELLAATESYLHQTYQLPFGVISSS